MRPSEYRGPVKFLAEQFGQIERQFAQVGQRIMSLHRHMIGDMNDLWRRSPLPRQSKRVLRCWAAGVLLGVSGCAPAITRFDVRPYQVCEGTPSAVTWDISGTPELTTTPAIQPLPGQPLRYQATEDTLFKLQVTRWPYNPKVSETEVTVHQTPAPMSEAIAFTMSCEGDHLIAILPRPATDWDPKIRLETVASDGSRDMTVEHEGRSATLTSSAPSTSAFQGVPMAGTWKLTMPLRPTERCGDPRAAPPARIILTTRSVCAR